MSDQLIIAFLLSLLAGLSTALGGVIGILYPNPNKNYLSFSMGFAAGVMIFVAMAEMFSEARHSLTEALGEGSGNTVAFLAFFGGMILTLAIDKLMPSYENPHEFHSKKELQELQKKPNLLRIGVLTAIALAMHNLPEGIATFAGSYEDLTLGVPIAVAVAIHNIPEGIAVAVPIFYATRNRKKAFWYSFLSGLAEPVGALLAFLFILHFWSDLTFGILFSVVSGIMVFISIDQLLPAAQQFGKHKVTMYGFIAGMIVMGASILMFI